MENFLAFSKDFSQLGTFIIALIFIGIHFWNVNQIHSSIDEIKKTLEQILIDNERKVPYTWIEVELKKFLPKDVADERANTIKESIRSLGERIGRLESDKSRV